MAGEHADGELAAERSGPGGSASPPPPPEPAAEQAQLGELRALDPRFVTAERISSLIVTGVLSGGGLVALLLDLVLSWWSGGARAAVWGAWLVLSGYLLWHSVAWPRIEQRAIGYRYGPGGIEIRRGVWWKRVITIPRSRIQHTDVTQGPMLRRFGLAALTVHTAATKTPSITLAGLAHQDAQRVRDALTSGSEGEGV